MSRKAERLGLGNLNAGQWRRLLGEIETLEDTPLWRAVTAYLGAKRDAHRGQLENFKNPEAALRFAQGAVSVANDAIMVLDELRTLATAEIARAGTDE